MVRKRAKAYSVLPFSLLLCLALAAAASGGPLTIGQQANPDPVARGEILTFAIAIANTGAVALTDLIFQDPLSTGIDQLHAEYRLNGGGWMAYPVNGIIALGTIDGGNTVSVEIQARVEHSAPSNIPNTVTVSDNSGPLASSTLVANMLPSAVMSCLPTPRQETVAMGSLRTHGATTAEGGVSTITLHFTQRIPHPT